MKILSRPTASRDVGDSQPAIAPATPTQALEAAQVACQQAVSELNRIDLLISERTQLAQQLRTNAADAERIASSASERLSELLAAAALDGEDAPEAATIEAARELVQTTKRTAQMARDTLGQADELESTARALAPRREQAARHIESTKAAELDARTAALREELEDRIRTYYSKAEAVIEAFYEMNERERALAALGSPAGVRTEDWATFTVPSVLGREYTGRSADEIERSVREAVEGKWGNVRERHWGDGWLALGSQRNFGTP